MMHNKKLPAILMIYIVIMLPVGYATNGGSTDGPTAPEGGGDPTSNGPPGSADTDDMEQGANMAAQQAQNTIAESIANPSIAAQATVAVNEALGRARDSITDATTFQGLTTAIDDLNAAIANVMSHVATYSGLEKSAGKDNAGKVTGAVGGLMSLTQEQVDTFNSLSEKAGKASEKNGHDIAANMFSNLGWNKAAELNAAIDKGIENYHGNFLESETAKGLFGKVNWGEINAEGAEKAVNSFIEGVDVIAGQTFVVDIFMAIIGAMVPGFGIALAIGRGMGGAAKASEKGAPISEQFNAFFDAIIPDWISNINFKNLLWFDSPNSLKVMVE